MATIGKFIFLVHFFKPCVFLPGLVFNYIRAKGMVAAPEEITALEKFFADRQLPKTLTILNSVTFTDLPKFIKQTIQFVKATDISDTMKRPRW